MKGKHKISYLFLLEICVLSVKASYLLTATVCKTAVIEDYIRLKLNTEVVSICCFGVKCIWSAFDLHVLRKTLVKAVPIEVTKGFYFNKNYALCATLFSNRDAIQKSISFSIFETEIAWKKLCAFFLVIYPHNLPLFWSPLDLLVLQHRVDYKFHHFSCFIIISFAQEESHVMCQGHRE